MRGSIIGAPWYLRQRPSSRSTIAVRPSLARARRRSAPCSGSGRPARAASGPADPVLDLARSLRRALAQAALELVDVRGDEDRHGARHSSWTWSAPSISSSSTQTRPWPAIRSISERACRSASATRTRRARETRPRQLCRRTRTLGEELVLAAVLLPGSLRAASSPRSRPPGSATRSTSAADQRSLAGSRGPGDHEHGSHGVGPAAAAEAHRLKRLTSSAR